MNLTQKIFIRYFVVIMVITVSLTLLGNFTLQTIFIQKKAEKDAAAIVREIAGRIEDNEQVIEGLIINLSDNYITRAQAFTEIIAQNPSIIESFDEMERIAKVLNVDEVHVIDEKGVLRWGNVRAYYGMDFAATDQTRPFLPALTDKSFKLAQEPQPNGNEGKLFQYIGVSRQDKQGIVQVGVAPEILDNALANNKINIVISNYNVASGIHVAAIDQATGRVVGDSQDELIGQTYQELGIEEHYYQKEKTSGWIEVDNQQVFAVFGEIGDYLIEVAFAKDQLFVERNNQNIVAAVSSIALGLAIIAAIFVLLKRMIIGDMDIVNHDLREITEGRLDVVVRTESTPEFVVLSDGINDMVGSLKRQLEKIEKQAAELSESNKNILSSLKYAKKIQNNLLPSSKAFDETFSDYYILWEPRDIVGGDIYWMKSFEEGAVLCVCDCTGHGTPGALLTMMVATALDAIVDPDHYSDPASILWELDQRLLSTLNVADADKDSADIHDGADLSIVYIRKDAEITLASAKLHVFVCNGKTVENIRGQKLSIGDGSIQEKERIKTLTIPACSENFYYIVSDGLFDQIGGGNCIPFGYGRFKQIILENHGHPLAEITAKIWSAFKGYMGNEERRDDVTLVSFRL